MTKKQATVVHWYDGERAHLRLSAPDRGNRLDWSMIVSMQQFVRAISRTGRSRALIIDAEGDDFCAGDCWPDMGEWPAEYAHRRPSGSHGPTPLPLIDLLSELRSLQIPSLVVLHGRVGSAGLDLACHCDIRLAAEDAVLQDDRVSNARFSATGITYTLPRLVGLANASRILLFGEAVSAREAERIGLIYKTVPTKELRQEASRLAETVSQMATRSFGLVKQQVIEQLDMSYRTALMHSLALRQTNIFEDRAEGQRAFMEKRAPRFSGR
jgi:2-(1,2-epoxy-1,2-dihydrophenyl)acetyl-CoA isomerase